MAAVAIAPFHFAEAGILSFLGSLLNGSKNQEISAELSPSRSSSLVSSMPLLDAPTNVNLNAGKGGALLSLVGQNALLPVVGPLGSIADVEEGKSDAISLYTVREGDSVASIAKTFGVSVNTILWANDIKRVNLVKPGDVLVILPVTGVKYTVKKGDTLKTITDKYKGDEDEILAFNGIDAAVDLKEGMEIIIPDGEVSVPVSQPKPKVAHSSPLAKINLAKDTAGYFMKPVNGLRTQGIHGYNGVDLGAPCGSSIYAAAAGTVILAKGAGWNGGYGQYTVISHANGTQTLYAHESQVLVVAGQYVAQGQLIGQVGNTGRSTGCHLHFEVRGAKNPF